MKWVLILILIVVIMLIARSVSEQYKDKYDFYKNLRDFLNQFKLNVSFKKETLNDFLNKTYCKKQFKIFIEEFQVFLQTNSINLNRITLLDEYEKDDLIKIMQNLGNLNSENEINQLNSFIAIIEEKLNKSLNDRNKLCPLILKLSLLFSIGLSILLI